MPLSRASGVPLYRQVVDAIGDGIARGRWAPGDRLPSEADLGLEFGVNRLTVRQAISELVGVGRLTVRHGVGTFVSDVVRPIDIDVATLTVEAATARTTSAFSAHGWVVRELLIGSGAGDYARAENGAATGEDADARRELENPAGPLSRIRTLTVANGEPWIVSSYWLEPELARAVRDGGDGDVFAALRTAFALRLRYVWRSFSATAATPGDADLLRVRVGSPLLVREGLNREQHGRPVTYVHRRARGDRARFVLRHDGPVSDDGPDAR